jgi:YggT family protein
VTFSGFVGALFWTASMAIFLRALLSWIPDLRPDHPIVRILNDITEPVLQPFRMVIPRVGMMDLSPLVAMIALSFAGQLLSNSLRSAGY